MSRPVTVALVDGPLPASHAALVERIDLAPDPATDGIPQCHAEGMAEAMLSAAPEARIVNLCIFAGRLSTQAEVVARALQVAAQGQVDIVQCSFGLARDDAAIAAAIRALVGRGTRVVAAAAARGARVYPAALRGVVAVQGDARCRPESWSWLQLPNAEFGACPRLAGRNEPAGASVAAAFFTGHLARTLVAGQPDPLDGLRQAAAFVGRERRSLAGQTPAAERTEEN